MEKYVGLIRADGSEPGPGSGYARARWSEENKTAVFPDSLGEGCGAICAVAFFDGPGGGAALETAALPAPVNVHSGVTPIYKDGRLLRGVAVRAEAISIPANFCGTAAMQKG